MPNILIRNVPEDLHAQLVADARAHGRSLQQHLLAVLSGRQAAWSSSQAVGQIMSLGRRLRADGYVRDWELEGRVAEERVNEGPVGERPVGKDSG